MSNDACNTDGFLSTLVPPALAVGGAIGGIVLGAQLALPPPVATSLTAGAAVTGFGYGKALTVSEDTDADFWRTLTGTMAGTTIGIAGSQFLQALIAPEASRLVFVGVGGGLGALAGDVVIAPVLTPGTRVGRGVIGLADSVSGLFGYAACEASKGAAAGLSEIKGALAPDPIKCKNGRKINRKRPWIEQLRVMPQFADFGWDNRPPTQKLIRDLMAQDPAWFGTPGNEEMVIDPALLTRLKQGAKGLVFGALGFIRGATATQGTVAFAGCMTPDEFLKTDLYKQKWKPWFDELYARCDNPTFTGDARRRAQVCGTEPIIKFGPGQPGRLPPVFGGPPRRPVSVDPKFQGQLGIGPQQTKIDLNKFLGSVAQRDTSRL